MHTVDHGDTRLDHYTLIADINVSLIPKCQHWNPVTTLRAPDLRAWEETQDRWRESTRRAFIPPNSADPYDVLKSWIQAAASQLPTRTIYRGGTTHRRPPHDSAAGRRLNKQIRTLEREIAIAPQAGPKVQITHSMRKISNWKASEGVSAIPLPERTSPDVSWTRWRDSLQEGIAERRKCLKKILRQEHNATLQEVKTRCRDRMERPGEKEIQRLLGKRIDSRPSETRASKLKQKRHPDKICAKLSDQKWEAWLTAIGGKELWRCAEQLRQQTDGGDSGDRLDCWHGRDMTVEISISSVTEMQLRISPMEKLTSSLERKPLLSPGEFIMITSSEAQKLKHATDTMCHEECFFATNALDAQTYCPSCCNPDRKPVPLSKIDNGTRSLRYFCPCGELRKTFPIRPLKPCPIPEEILSANGFQSTDPILTGPLTRDDFDVWLRKRPSGTSPGDDSITYEMWQASPEPMKDALYRAVSKALTSGRIPQEWEGALVKLLVKRPGEEHLMESLRPICLMATAAKITTGIWAYRLSQAAERDRVYEGAQEGFRPDRSARRQITRLISCIQHCKKANKKLIVAFLDFENYFNTISLAAVFTILRKLNMPEADVQALERYYALAHMRVSHADGQKSAAIPLGRGLRQGCPLSPILGGLVVNAMLRWLEQQGGGVQHPSGVETNVLAFADDATLLTENIQHMAKLMQCVHEFCAWAGVHINMGKSEIAGYDFGRSRAINTRGLQIGGGHPKHIRPDTPFKYLGLRLTIMGDMTAEREYVMQKSEKLGSMLKGHPYHPRQMHIVVQSAIIPIFRYSAAMAQWTSKDLSKLWKVWCRAFKHAWKLKPTIANGFFYTAQHGGLDAASPGEIWVKETAGQMEQCFAIPSELSDMLKFEMCHLILDLGCTTLEELQRHLLVAQPSYPPDTFCYAFLSAMNHNAAVRWASITREPRDEACYLPIRITCESLKSTGLMSLLDDATQLAPQDRAAVTKLLLDISLLGFHRLSTVLHQGVLQLPGMAKPDSDMCSRLQRFFGLRNLQMEWLDSGRKGTAFRDVLAKIRKGEEGQALVGSRVQLRTGKGGRWGTISSYCTDTRLYTVDMQDLTNVSLTHAKVLEYWMPPLSHSNWTREDQKHLGSQIRRIVGCRNVIVSRQLRTPHHTMLTSETWTASEKWYICEMSVAFPTQYEDLFTKRRSHEMDLRIATKLCEDQVVFWAPKVVWNWQSTSHSNRAGWFVRAMSMHEKERGVIIMVRSLHQEEQHREGEIWMSSEFGPSIRSIHATHNRRTQPPMVSLSAAEVGDVDEGGHFPSIALEQYRARMPAPPPTNATSDNPSPIHRRSYPKEKELLHATFGIDMTSLKSVDQSFCWKGRTSAITLRHGQACLGRTTSLVKRRTLRDGALTRPKQKGLFPIDECRLALFRLWYGKTDMISIWQKEWSKLNTWEAEGGRILHWAVTSHICEHYGAHTTVCVHRLAVDPSFTAYISEDDTSTEGPVYLPLYEMPPERALNVLKRHADSPWVAVVRSDKPSVVLKHIRSIGTLGQRFDKGAKIKMKKGWWETGERTIIKSDGVYEIWHSKYPQKEYMELQMPFYHWMPHKQHQRSVSLQTYLTALPGYGYRSQGTVVATDGSLRTRKHTTGEMSMGAGIAAEDGDLHLSFRVGGQFSSTRSELVAIVLALRTMEQVQSLFILVDSAAALQRLAWCRSREFCPSPRKMKDVDVMHDIMTIIRMRQDAGRSTTFVKVHGHSGDPLHSVADHMARQGAEIDYEAAEYAAPRPECILYEWAKEGTLSQQQWGPQIKKRIKQVMGQRAWEARVSVKTTEGSVDEFMNRGNSGRDILGQALRNSWDWAVRGWILALSPYSYPIKVNYVQWGKSGSSQCACGQSAESFIHLQLSCPLEHRRNARQEAHNRVAKIVENCMDDIHGNQRISVWDKQVSTFLHSLEMSRPQALLLNALTIAELWAWKCAIGQKRTPQQQAGRKRTLDDIKTYFEGEDLNKRPDGMIFDFHHRTIYVIEVARTGDSPGSLRNRYLKKTLKYAPIVEGLRKAFTPCKVEQITLVVGLLGSIEESRWRQSLESFGMTKSQQDKLIRRCMVATIEGTHLVLGSGET